MRIETRNSCPDSTYFRTGDVEPDVLEDGSICTYTGEGSRRSSWGAPGVTSTIVLDESDFAAIHIGYHHKHGGGQFWRYYMTDGATTTRVTWAALPDELRMRIIVAYEAKAPGWADPPGKLRTERVTPAQTKRTTYKIVEVDGERLISLYDGATAYTLGKRLAEAVARDAGGQDAAWYEVKHAGGFYSYPNVAQVKQLWDDGSLVPERCYRADKQLAVIECEISGRIARFPNGKLASTYLTPTRIVETFGYTPGTRTDRRD